MKNTALWKRQAVAEEAIPARGPSNIYRFLPAWDDVERMKVNQTLASNMAGGALRRAMGRSVPLGGSRRIMTMGKRREASHRLPILSHHLPTRMQRTRTQMQNAQNSPASTNPHYGKQTHTCAKPDAPASGGGGSPLRQGWLVPTHARPFEAMI